MVIDNLGINEEYWANKTLKEFEKFCKGKIRSDKIKPAFDSLPKVPKPPKEKVKKEENK